MRPSELYGRLMPLRESEIKFKNIQLNGTMPQGISGMTYKVGAGNDIMQRMTVKNYIKIDSHIIGLHLHTRYMPVNLHAHEFIEIMYLYSGRCVNVVDREHFELSEGEMCVISPGVFHQPVPEDDSVLINILVRKSFFQSLHLNEHTPASDYFNAVAYEAEYPKCLKVKLCGEQRMLCELLICEKLDNTESTISDETAQKLLELMLVYISRSDDILLYGNFHSQKSGIEPILRYIDDNHSNQLTLNGISEVFHYSKEHICRMLKTETGCTFSELLRKSRIENARKLLENTSMTLEEIALQVGYDNIKSFYRSFKSENGIPPGKFKEMIINKIQYTS